MNCLSECYGQVAVKVTQVAGPDCQSDPACCSRVGPSDIAKMNATRWGLRRYFDIRFGSLDV